MSSVALRIYYGVVVALRIYYGVGVALRIYYGVVVALRIYYGVMATLWIYYGVVVAPRIYCGVVVALRIYYGVVVALWISVSAIRIDSHLSVLGSHDGEASRQWSLLEIRSLVLLRSAISQKQFIIITIITRYYHSHLTPHNNNKNNVLRLTSQLEAL